MLVALRDADISLSAFSVSKPTLDEVFLALTGHDAGESNAAAQADALPDPQELS